MIEAAREGQLAQSGDFALALTSWLHGGDGADEEAASGIVAETILLHRMWLKSKFK